MYIPQSTPFPLDNDAVPPIPASTDPIIVVPDSEETIEQVGISKNDYDDAVTTALDHVTSAPDILERIGALARHIVIVTTSFFLLSTAADNDNLFTQTDQLQLASSSQSQEQQIQQQHLLHPRSSAAQNRKIGIVIGVLIPAFIAGVGAFMYVYRDSIQLSRRKRVRGTTYYKSRSGGGGGGTLSTGSSGGSAAEGEEGG